MASYHRVAPKNCTINYWLLVYHWGTICPQAATKSQGE